MQEVLDIADHLVFAKTGKHLNDLQQAILQGTLEGKRYPKIAAENHRTEKYVKDVGGKLWKILSDVLEENVSKSNLKTTLEKVYNYNSLNGIALVNSNNVNLYRKLPPTNNIVNSPEKEDEDEKETNVEVREDLDDAPRGRSFYGRNEELAILETAILEARCGIVAILGITGIGKSALGAKLVAKIKKEFDCIIWRSLHFLPTLEETITDILQFASHKETRDRNKLGLLKSYLRDRRCLIILDDVQTIFSAGKPAGTYKKGYEDYSSWFKTLGEVSHNSCLLLLSREKPREIALLETSNSYCTSLRLTGLGAAGLELLKEKGVSEHEGEKLVDIYGGNPLYLEIVATVIQDLFGGGVNDFLKYSQSLLTHDMIPILEQQFQRLSPSEANLIRLLAHETTTVSLNQLQAQGMDLLKDIQSLKRRFLLETKEEDSRMVFSLDPILKEYIQHVPAS